jgi:ribonuclease HI
MSFVIYSDGSGITGGPAGIGFVVFADGLPFSEGSLPLADATNHQAELIAATTALLAVPEGQDVLLISDSRYLVNGWMEYLPRWLAHGWRTSGSGAGVTCATAATIRNGTSLRTQGSRFFSTERG